MAKLKFKEDADGKPTKEAVGMYSKDGEYVDFDEPCKCVGQVISKYRSILCHHHPIYVGRILVEFTA